MLFPSPSPLEDSPGLRCVIFASVQRWLYHTPKRFYLLASNSTSNTSKAPNVAPMPLGLTIKGSLEYSSNVELYRGLGGKFRTFMIDDHQFRFPSASRSSRSKNFRFFLPFDSSSSLRLLPLMSQVSGVRLFDNQAPASITITKLFQISERSDNHLEFTYVIKVTPSLLLFVTLVTNI